MIGSVDDVGRMQRLAVVVARHLLARTCRLEAQMPQPTLRDSRAIGDGSPTCFSRSRSPDIVAVTMLR